MHSVRARFPTADKAIDFVTAVRNRCNTAEVLEARRDGEVVRLAMPVSIDLANTTNRLLSEMGGHVEGSC